LAASLRPSTWSLIRSWLLAKDSEVRGKPLQVGRTYRRRRTLRKTKTARKAMGNHPGKYLIRETMSMQLHHFVDMPSRPLPWSITPRHDMLKNIINLLVTAED